MHVDMLGPVSALTHGGSVGVWFQKLPQDRRSELLSWLCRPTRCCVTYFPSGEEGENKFINEAACLQAYLCVSSLFVSIFH